MFSMLTCLALSAPVPSDDWYAKAVKSVELTVSPAEAKPGQTVTIKITIDLNEPYHTYPLVQPDRKAVDQTNRIELPAHDAKGLIFVGPTKDPANPTKKAEPLLGIKEMHLFSGTVTYEQKAVVSPNASGELTITIPKFTIQVCDETNCFPAKTLSPTAKMTVTGAAVEVQKEYKDEVEKVLKGK